MPGFVDEWSSPTMDFRFQPTISVAQQKTIDRRLRKLVYHNALRKIGLGYNYGAQLL